MKADTEVIAQAVALLNKDDYAGAALVLDASERLRRYAEDCRAIAMSWQQGAVVGALQSELENLKREGGTA